MLALSIPLMLFNLFQFFADVQIILKIFTFMAIYSFARNHIGGGPLAVIVILVMSFFVLFVLWPLFGTLYLLYMLGMMGLCSILIDFFFVTGTGAAGAEEGPVSSGVDIARRMMAQKAMAARRRRPRMPGR